MRVLVPHITEENESLQLFTTKLEIVCCISVQIQPNHELSFEIFFCLKTRERLWSLSIYISVIIVYSQIPLFYRIQIIKTFRHWVIHFIQKISLCFVRCNLIHNNFFYNCCGLIFNQFHYVNSWMQSCRCSSNDRDLRPSIRGWAWRHLAAVLNQRRMKWKQCIRHEHNLFQKKDAWAIPLPVNEQEKWFCAVTVLQSYREITWWRISTDY